MAVEPTRWPDALGRSLEPPPGGAARLARSLAASTHRSSAQRRGAPRIAFAGLALATLVGLSLAIAPLREALDRERSADQLAARLSVAIAEAGRPGPDIQLEDAQVDALPSGRPGVRLYRVTPLTR